MGSLYLYLLPYSWTNSLKTQGANPVTTSEAPSGELSGELTLNSNDYSTAPSE